MSDDTAAPQRDPATGQFLVGHIGVGGRPGGAKNKLADLFWRDFASTWEEHGKEALVKVATEEPAKFVTVAASVMPKELKIESSNLTDEQVSARIQQLSAALGDAVGLIAGIAGAVGGEEAPARPDETLSLPAVH